MSGCGQPTFACGSRPSPLWPVNLLKTDIGAASLRRDAKGDWPESPQTIEDGVLDLRSIALPVDLAALYRGTRLAPP